MPEHLFIASYDETTKRHAVLEDDGLTAWLYLHAPSNTPNRTAAVEKACFAYNRIAPIAAEAASSYRPSPPPIAQDYATGLAVINDPDARSWAIHWSKDGGAVLLSMDGEPWCVIEAGGKSRHGHCKSIRADGPWGSPWDEQKFRSIEWEGK
jgi:hypothetical protein